MLVFDEVIDDGEARLERGCDAEWGVHVLGLEGGAQPKRAIVCHLVCLGLSEQYLYGQVRPDDLVLDDSLRQPSEGKARIADLIAS